LLNSFSVMTPFRSVTEKKRSSTGEVRARDTGSMALVLISSEDGS